MNYIPENFYATRVNIAQRIKKNKIIIMGIQKDEETLRLKILDTKMESVREGRDRDEYCCCCR
jgi:hypothetical protein